MHDPDEDGGSGDDWNLSPSPSISSLSSFSPEDFSFALQPQQHTDDQQPDSEPEPEHHHPNSKPPSPHQPDHSPHHSPHYHQPHHPQQQQQYPQRNLYTPPPTSSPDGSVNTLHKQRPWERDQQQQPEQQHSPSSSFVRSLALGLHTGRGMGTGVGMGVGIADVVGMGMGMGGGVGRVVGRGVDMGVSGGGGMGMGGTPLGVGGWIGDGVASGAGAGTRTGGQFLFRRTRDDGDGRGEMQMLPPPASTSALVPPVALPVPVPLALPPPHDSAEEQQSPGRESLGEGGHGTDDHSWDQDRAWVLPGRGYESPDRHELLDDRDGDEDGYFGRDHDVGYAYGYDGSHEGADESGYLAEGEEVEGDDLPQDAGRVELMERLCELVQRISSARVGGGMEADVLDVLHDKIDEMEGLLAMAEDAAAAEDTAHAGMEEEEEGQVETRPEEDELATEENSDVQRGYEDDGFGSRETTRGASERQDTITSLPSPSLAKQDILDLASPSPWLATSFRFSELSLSPTGSHPELAAATNEALEAAKQAAQAQDEMVERVANEAEELNREMAKIVQSLQERKEESDHLHALLVERAEGAATRILDLEKEVCDLEDDILSNESELRHLRLKLRAVETLCHEFVPPDADPVLVQSIENWKADWLLVRDRMLDRKRDRRDRRIRLRRDGCVLGSLGEGDDGDGSTLTSLGGLSILGASFLGGGSPRKNAGGLRVSVGTSPRKGY